MTERQLDEHEPGEPETYEERLLDYARRQTTALETIALIIKWVLVLAALGVLVGAIAFFGSR